MRSSANARYARPVAKYQPATIRNNGGKFRHAANMPTLKITCQRPGSIQRVSGANTPKQNERKQNPGEGGR